MSRFLRRCMPVVALGVAALLGGCIVAPPWYGYYGHGYERGGYERGGHWGGWHR